MGTAALVIGIAMVLLVAVAIVASPGRPRSANAGRTDGRNAAVGAPGSEQALQVQLTRVPRDWASWAALGSTYLDKARQTADPTYYGKAQGAFAQSLAIRPTANGAALDGQAALAATRHDFTRARDLATAALRIDSYDSTALGVLADAETELGRYDSAADVVQRLLDVKPGIPAFTRASYQNELRGRTDDARAALESALEVAGEHNNDAAAFALQYLAELAFNAGDLRTADERVAEGLRRSPSYVPLLADRARILTADGHLSAARATWAEVVQRLPSIAYLSEYGDLLTAMGDSAGASAQFAVVRASARLFRAQGADVDLEMTLFDADHGQAVAALSAAAAEYRRRQSIHVEDAFAWALHRSGRDKEALVHATRAARLGFRSATFAYHKGMIEHALGLDSAARHDLRRALEINHFFSIVQAPIAKSTLAQIDRKA